MVTKIESVELKGVKIASNMSEETVAFTGSLYINGKKAADLKNDGNGGANFAWFNDRELEKAFDAYCESLPQVEGSEGRRVYALQGMAVLCRRRQGSPQNSRRGTGGDNQRAFPLIRPDEAGWFPAETLSAR